MTLRGKNFSHAGPLPQAQEHRQAMLGRFFLQRSSGCLVFLILVLLVGNSLGVEDVWMKCSFLFSPLLLVAREFLVFI